VNRQAPLLSATDAGPCRIIIDREPAPGPWNMAVDQALLESAVAGGWPTVRWYRWDRPTISLGYFQSRDTAGFDERLKKLPIVRRLSGGGAIVHHHELTYACALPASHPLAGAHRTLYTGVHERIIAVLAEFGYRAQLRGTSVPGRGGEFLCFQRGDDFDVVMTGQKVLGSAQRRRKGAVLQHGSLVLRRSEWAPEFPGIFDCGEHDTPVAELVDRLADRVAGLLAATTISSPLTDLERASAVSHAEQAI
jgi:lipoate-protein ligase A